MTRAVIYITDYHYSERLVHPERPNDFIIVDHHPKPLDMQEQACRTYCERQGYAIVAVHRGTTKVPDNVERTLRMRIVPEPYKFFFAYASKHPYYLAKNMLECDDADVLVNFCETGPSRSLWSEMPGKKTKGLTPIEYASLWPSVTERVTSRKVKK